MVVGKCSRTLPLANTVRHVVNQSSRSSSDGLTNGGVSLASLQLPVIDCESLLLLDIAQADGIQRNLLSERF